MALVYDCGTVTSAKGWGLRLKSILVPAEVKHLQNVSRVERDSAWPPLKLYGPFTALSLKPSTAISDKSGLVNFYSCSHRVLLGSSTFQLWVAILVSAVLPKTAQVTAGQS